MEKKNKPIDFSSEVVLITLYHLLGSSTSCIFASYLRWSGFLKVSQCLKRIKSDINPVVFTNTVYTVNDVVKTASSTHNKTVLNQN